MKKNRTQDQIEEQVFGLKKMKDWLPEKSVFGDDNWGAIDAQINVLSGKYGADKYEFADPDIYSAAENAEMWLNGYSNEDLFETE